MKFTCKVINGKLPDKEKLEIVKFLKKNEGKKILFEMRNAEVRSIELNDYYWGTFLPTICLHWKEEYNVAHSSSSMNEIIKDNFSFVMVGDVKHVKSTSELTIAQMIAFFKQVDLWCVESFRKGIKKPNSNEEWNSNFF